MNRNEKYRSEIRNLYRDGDSFEQTKNTRRGVSVPSKGIDVITSREDMGYRVPKNVTDVEPIKRGIYVVGAKEKNPIVKITIPKGTTSKMNSIPKKERVQKIKKRNELKDLLLRLAIAGVATTILVMLARGCSSPTIQTETSNSSYEVENKQNIFDSYIHILQDEDLTEEKMKSMPGRIALILEDTIEPKIKDTLGYPVDTVDIVSEPSPNINGGSTEKIIVSHTKKDRYGRELEETKETYIEDAERIPFEDIIPFADKFMDRKHTFDQDIAMVIYEWRRMNELDELQENGENININEIRRECIRALKEAKKFDEKQFQTDDKGNISAVKQVKNMGDEAR